MFCCAKKEPKVQWLPQCYTLPEEPTLASATVEDGAGDRTTHSISLEYSSVRDTANSTTTVLQLCPLQSWPLGKPSVLLTHARTRARTHTTCRSYFRSCGQELGVKQTVNLLYHPMMVFTLSITTHNLKPSR